MDEAWKKDLFERTTTNWQSDTIQLIFAVDPSVSPALFVSRVKGRLQHALRQHGTPAQFSRKVSFRGIGENHSEDVERYLRKQVDKERFVDPRFSDMLRQFTIVDESVKLQEPTETNSGRYWYHLHVVLVTSGRVAIRSEQSLAKLDQIVKATADKHGCGLAVRA